MSPSEYIDSLIKSGWISEHVAGRANDLLSVVRHLPLPEPQIAPGPDGVVGMNWSDDRNYVSVELLESGSLEEFHEDLVTGDLWSCYGLETSSGFLERLSRIR